MKKRKVYRRWLNPTDPDCCSFISASYEVCDLARKEEVDKWHVLGSLDLIINDGEYGHQVRLHLSPNVEDYERDMKLFRSVMAQLGTAVEMLKEGYQLLEEAHAEAQKKLRK